MTSQHRVFVLRVCVRVHACVRECACGCVSVIGYTADEKKTSVPHITSSCQKAFMPAPGVTRRSRRACAHARESVCVSLTVGVSVVTLGRGVSCVTNSDPDHSLWVSYLLQS